ncbi:MAG: Zn-dependent oligopeptidase [Actinobacteria bacterium]|nr:Zn-dependent oligopeptidase [Actinomycetota bacterium]
MLPKIETLEQIIAFLPKSVEEIIEFTQKTIINIEQQIKNILDLSDINSNFYNTAQALDIIQTTLLIGTNTLRVVESVYPDEASRNIAHKCAIELNCFGIDAVWQNKKLYQAFTNYIQNVSCHENLSNIKKYFIDQELDLFHRNGLHLSEADQDTLKELQKKLIPHGLQFERNITDSVRTIEVEQEELIGCSKDFISKLVVTADGKYIISTSNGHYVLKYCTVELTRKKIWYAIVNRCYPENNKELESIITLRQAIGQLLGYESFTDFDLANQMVKTTQQAEEFLHSVKVKAQKKAVIEIENLKNNKSNITYFTQQGILLPWNVSRIKASIPSIDHQKIAQYFPLDHVLNAFFDLYKAFFGIVLQKNQSHDLWHTDVECISAYKNGEYLGAIFLDFFYRPGKYNSARYLTMIPAMLQENSGDTVFYPALGLVILDLPAKQSGKPILLYHSDVATLFHELGHALHALLSKAEFGILSAMRVKRDFLEMPSQMLERWIWDPEILRFISSHYITKESLPFDLINELIESQYNDIGDNLCTQLSYSFQALDYFKENKLQSVHEIYHKIYLENLPYLEYSTEDHSYCHFWHVYNYGAKYYGYLWSQVFASDIFAYIKQYGLFNREIGEKYTNLVLAPGATQDPEELLQNFLGRKPNVDAFFKDLRL